MLLQWIVGLFAISLLISQSALGVFSALMIVTLFWIGWRWREQESANSIFVSIGADWIFLVWFFVVFAGLAINGFKGQWLLSLYEFKWIIAFYFLTAAIKYIQPGEKITIPAVIIYLICAIYAIAVWFLRFDPIRPEIPLQQFSNNVSRTAGFLSEPVVFAHVYSLPLSIFVGLWFSFLRWRARGGWLIGLTILFGILALLFSFTRGVWISFSVALLVMTFLHSRKTFTLFLLLGGMSVGTMYGTWPAFRERLHTVVDGKDIERLWTWRANLQMFLDHPGLGIGYGENVLVLPEYYKKVGAPENLPVGHPHNQYVHMLAGTGAVGLGVYLIILGYFLLLAFRVWSKVSYRNIFHYGLSLGLIGAQVAFFVGGLTETNLEFSRLRYTLIFVWALTVWLAYEYRVLREKI